MKNKKNHGGNAFLTVKYVKNTVVSQMKHRQDALKHRLIMDLLPGEIQMIRRALGEPSMSETPSILKEALLEKNIDVNQLKQEQPYKGSQIQDIFDHVSKNIYIY